MTDLHRGLTTVDLRDEAVRVLRRAVEHVEALQYREALETIQGEGVAWWDQAQYAPGLVCFTTSRKTA